MMMQEDLDQNNSTPAEETENVEETTGAATEEVAADEVDTTVAVEATADDKGTEERVPHRKVRTGLVVSDKMDKSIVVLVTRRVKHPLYNKYYFKSKKYMAHDEENDCGMGDTVRIAETRPMSARKRWALETIVERAK